MRCQRCGGSTIRGNGTCAGCDWDTLANSSPRQPVQRGRNSAKPAKPKKKGSSANGIFWIILIVIVVLYFA